MVLHLSASYVEVDETLIEDHGQDVLKLDARKEAHDQGEPSENDGQRAVHNNSRVEVTCSHRVRTKYELPRAYPSVPVLYFPGRTPRPK